MQGVLATIFIITQMVGSVSVAQTYEYVGQMPEVVITAPRYEFEDEAWSGLMDTIYVTAPRILVAEASPKNTKTSFLPYALPIYSLILGIGVAIAAVFLSLHSNHKQPKHAPVLCRQDECKTCDIPRYKSIL